MDNNYFQSYLQAGLNNLQHLINRGFQEILIMGEMFDDIIKENNELKERIKELEEFFKIAKERD